MDIEAAEKRISELAARIEELERAVAPFAHFYDGLTDEDGPQSECKLTVADYRRAFDVMVYR